MPNPSSIFYGSKWQWYLIGGFFLSFVLDACSYSNKAANRILAASRNTTYDLVIVPGVPLENGKWSKTMRGRIYWAKYLYDQGIAKNIMFSGSSVYTPYYEGIVMAQYAKALGIAPANIFYETEAEHSVENIYYSYNKAKQLGFEKIALASDPFQTRLLRRFTRRKVSADVTMLPMVKDTIKAMEPGMVDPVIDIKQAYNDDFISLRKRESYFKRLKGTMGYNLKDSTGE